MIGERFVLCDPRPTPSDNTNRALRSRAPLPTRWRLVLDGGVFSSWEVLVHGWYPSPDGPRLWLHSPVDWELHITAAHNV